MARVASMVVSGVVGLFMARTILAAGGVDQYALFAVLISIPALLPFADLGVGAAIVNAVAESKDPDNEGEVKRVLLASMRVALTASLIIISLGIAVGLLGAWPLLLALPGDANQINILASACLALFASAVPFSLGTRILLGKNKNHLVVLIQGLQTPATYIVILCLFAFGRLNGETASYSYFIAFLVVALIAAGAGVRELPRAVRWATRSLGALHERGSAVMRTGWPMLIQLVSLPLALQSARVVLSHQSGPEQVATYTLGSQLFSPIASVAAVGGATLWPYFAARRGSGAGAAQKLALMFSGVGLVLSAVAVAISPLVLPLASGGLIEAPTTVMLAFLFQITVQASVYPLGMFLTTPAGLRFQVLPVLAMVATTVTMSWLLSPSLGAAAPPLALGVGALVFQAIPYWFRVSRERL